MRRFISLEEMQRLSREAVSPADLIDLLPSYGIHLDFSEHLSFMWRKNFDKEKDLALLRRIQHRSDYLIEDFRNNGHDL